MTMRMAEAVEVYQDARRRARSLPTFALRVQAARARGRMNRRPSERDQARSKAIARELHARGKAHAAALRLW
jgi:hypothetical protein